MYWLDQTGSDILNMSINSSRKLNWKYMHVVLSTSFFSERFIPNFFPVSGVVSREIRFCQKMGLPILGIIENLSGFCCPCCSVSFRININIPLLLPFPCYSCCCCFSFSFFSSSYFSYSSYFSSYSYFSSSSSLISPPPPISTLILISPPPPSFPTSMSPPPPPLPRIPLYSYDPSHLLILFLLTSCFKFLFLLLITGKADVTTTTK